jgi:hypothetical protein
MAKSSSPSPDVKLGGSVTGHTVMAPVAPKKAPQPVKH